MSRRLLRGALTLTTSVLLTVSMIIVGGLPARAATTLNGHTVVLDSTGKLLSWVAPADQAYGKVSQLAWDYLLNSVPTDENGKPAYYSHSYLNPNTQELAGWPHNPAGLYGMLTESAVRYYQYSGDARVLQLAQNVVDYQLAHGMTASSDSWSSVPYASGDSGSTTYQGAGYGDSSGSGDGTGVIEPDKIGEFGHALIQLYKITGKQAYLDAAVTSANALVSHQRPGSATQSPWPFRVEAKTNKTRVEDYGANVAGNLDLFDDLIGLGQGDVAGYQKARTVLWNWTMAYPMKTNNWSGYFEDVEFHKDPSDNLNQLDAMMFARYLLLHTDQDANWQSDVRGLISWVEDHFGVVDENGATTIKEQNAFQFRMGSHTSRYAEVNALLYEKTGDQTALEKAYRSFNWATYMARSNGVVIDGPEVNNQWFTDGYGDYIRHFMIGMGAAPQWAPTGQTHLLESSSVITKISYPSGGGLAYTAYDAAGTEKIKMSLAPVSVSVDGTKITQGTSGWSYDTSSQVLTIKRTSGRQVEVGIDSQPTDPTNVAPVVAITAPLAGATAVEGEPLPVTATATDVDGTVDHVDLLVDGNLIGRDTASPYSASATGLSVGPHTVTALAVDNDGASTTSAPVSVSVTAADSTGWRSTDIGSVGVAGSDAVSGSTVTVKASGIDIWGTSDAFRFRYRAVSGDTSVTARVVSQQDTDPWALAGVMIRSSAAADSPHVLLALTPEHGLSFDYRSSSGAETSYADAGAGQAPIWLRLTRTGSTVVAESSADGATWTEAGRVDIDLGTGALAGLAVTSHDNATLGTAVFDSVTAGDTTPPVITKVAAGSINLNGGSISWTTDEPATSQIEYGTTTGYGSSTAQNSSLVTDHVQVVSGLLPGTTYHYRVSSTDAAGNTAVSPDATFVTAGDPPGTGTGGTGGTEQTWQGRDVGDVGVPGSDSAAGSVVTVAGSGSDIWGSADAFRFRSTTLNGDGSITARLVSQQVVTPDALAGVMIRSSADAGSAHVMLALTPGYGLSFDYRSATGQDTSYVDGGPAPTPVWLRLTRTGDVVVGEQSADGKLWDEVGRATVPLGDVALAGLAVASHDNAALGTAVFDSVAAGPTSGSSSGSATPVAIEAFAASVPSVSCDQQRRPGVVKLTRLLTSYAGSAVRQSDSCPDVPTSGRDDGRSMDWMVSAHSSRQTRQASKMLGWLLGKDRRGVSAGRARRLGVSAVEWNNRIWRSDQAAKGWRSLGSCSSTPQRSRDAACRRDHLEITLSWEGANAKTSYWTRKVAAREYGPCAPADLSWAPNSSTDRTTPCPKHSAPKAPKKASAQYRALLRYSGMSLQAGSKGAAVKVVQKTLKIKTDGVFGARTVSTLKTWQRAHKVTAGGRMDASTWRAMLKAARPA